MSIQSFNDPMAEALFSGRRPRAFPADLAKVARRKLEYLEAATTLNDLRSPPGNHLEALKRDRTGQHSIRINKQYRICFRWTDAGPENVEVTDYHDG